MAAIGAKYKWNNGRILHASRLWKSPTKRRLPRILIEDRAQEVGIKMYLEEPWMVFEETKEPASTISTSSAIPMDFYLGRYYWIHDRVTEAQAIWDLLRAEQRSHRVTPSPYLGEIEEVMLTGNEG